MRPMHEKIYEFVVGYILDHKYPPSIREIGAGVGLKSTSSVHRHVSRMLERGVFETDARFNSPRAIRVPGLVITRREEGKGAYNGTVEG